MKSHFTNAVNAQDAQTKAIERAQGALKARGLHYPMYDPKLPLHENYERLRQYSAEEAALVYEFLNQNPNPRPLVADKVQPKKDWGSSYYDK